LNPAATQGRVVFPVSLPSLQAVFDYQLKFGTIISQYFDVILQALI